MPASPLHLFLILAALSNISIQSQFLAFYPQKVLTTSQYQCIKDTGYNRTLIWVQSTSQGIDQQSIQNLINANNAGLQVEVYFTPCRARSAFAQFALIMKNIGTLFHTIWIYPKTASDGACSWYEYPAEFNCMYLQQFVAEVKRNGKSVAIVGSRYQWARTFQNFLGCQQVNGLDLLWVPSGIEVDKKPNFDSYQQIGGWQKPYAKLYRPEYICGQIISLVYYP